VKLKELLGSLKLVSNVIKYALILLFPQQSRDCELSDDKEESDEELVDSDLDDSEELEELELDVRK
jgi:hypothetical protein